MTAEPFITVRPGRTANDIPTGVYQVVLTGISDPRFVLAQRGPNAGKEIELHDWNFAIVGGPHDEKEIQASTSTASGPRSKMYAYLTALFGGVPPTIGSAFAKSDLVGRMALATVRQDEEGWPRIENLGAIPASMLGQQVAAATGVPVAPPSPAPVATPQAAAPLRAQVTAANTDDLPF